MASTSKRQRSRERASGAAATGNSNSAPRTGRPRRAVLGWTGALLLVLASVWVWLASARDDAPPAPASPATAESHTTSDPTQSNARPPAAEPTFVGTTTCQGCHAAEFAAWHGSQHDRAMQLASEASVVGDFSDATFSHGGVDSRFFRKNDRYFVRTDGSDGALADFEIRYTFGVDPLQQYLIEFPDGRLQALSIAWDARPAAEGGQRWFHLYPDETIDYRDELHWTRRAQNWNFMCADCHSTDLRKGYDAATGGFHSEWAEINVGCEACHGPGSAHVAWATTRPADPTRGLTVQFHQRRGTHWTIDPATGNAARSVSPGQAVETEVCAQCHARRAQIAEGYHAGRPFLDHYLPALLQPPQYHADGQQREEVYIWGSFLQSKMYAHGVTCSDCHDPHSQTLRGDRDDVCAQCHLPAKYAAAAHHHHAEGAPGSACVDCHMPTTTYMVVDPRRDHSLRIPRPDQTESLGTPNACNTCHEDRSPAWASAAIREWTGHDPAGFQRFAATFGAAAAGAAAAVPELAALANDRTEPAIVRASAAGALGGYPASDLPAALRAGLADADPLVRLGSLQALDAMPAAAYARAVVPLLSDSYRAIRIEAVRLLAPLPTDQLAPVDRAAFAAAAQDYVATLNYNADRPEAHTALGTFHAARGELEQGERELRAAIAMDASYQPAYVNLADLERTRGRNADAEAVLREGLAANPNAAGLHHALGLALVRLGRTPDALVELARAAGLAPEEARFAYVHAVALNSAGRLDDALTELDRALAGHPDHRDLLMAGMLFARDGGRPERALHYARALARAYPDDPEVGGLAAQLEQAMQ